MAVPGFVARRKTAVPAVTRIGNASPMICVQLTRTSPICVVPPRRRQRDRRARPAPQTHCISPSRISRKPSVAVALTSGSRAANGGPKSDAVQRASRRRRTRRRRGTRATRDPGAVEQRPGDQGAHRPDRAVGEVQHAGRPVEDDEADTGHGEHAAERQAEHEERLEIKPSTRASSRSGIGSSGHPDRLDVGHWLRCSARAPSSFARICSSGFWARARRSRSSPRPAPCCRPPARR